MHSRLFVLTNYMYNDIKIRLFCEDSLNSKKEVTLKKEQTHYLRDVMRCDVGAKILLFDGVSGEYLSEITHIDRKKTRINILLKTKCLEIPGDVWIIFCPLKKKRTDFLVEKCTELGVRKFLPILSHNTQTKRVSINRLKTQIIEAVEQCGGNFIPEMDALDRFERVLENFPKNRKIIFCDETLEYENIQKALNEPGLKRVGIFVGPEGGFSSNERKMVQKAGEAVRVSLGKRILRAETAAVSALASWHSVSGDWVK